MNDASAFGPNDVIAQRKRTAEVVPAWGLKAVYAHAGSKVPISKITDASLLKVNLDEWVVKQPHNLLGIMPRDMVDFDLDIRVRDDFQSRAPQWTDAERLFVHTDILTPFRDAFMETLEHFDLRAMFGRNSLGGEGHLLLKIAASEERTIQETRDRLKQLAFQLNLGHFSVKLEVRQPPRKAGGATFVFLPGSTYSDDDYCRFRSMPKGPTSIVNNALHPYPLELVVKAVYRAALTLACRPMIAEGQRHEHALLISGVLRREVERTERDGGDFTRADAEAIFRGLFQGDPELRDRMQIFEQDFARAIDKNMAGYNRLGEHIGVEAANALRLMLTGHDMSMYDTMRERIVFVREQGMRCIDVSQRTGTKTLNLFEHTGIRNNYAEYRIRSGRKEIPVFDILKNSKGRRQVDDVIAIPGYPRGAELWQARGSGDLFLDRVNDTDQHVINISEGWAQGYDPDDKSLPRKEASLALKDMFSWLSDKPADWDKLMQMWAFKAQNPLVKPQFALGIYGGQGIGKSFVMGTVARTIFGLSVKETDANNTFGADFALNAAIGASFLIVEEVKDLVNFSLAKGLARSEWHEINVKFQAKAHHRIFAIPIYLTNAPHPQFNLAGEVDRTLYVIKAPTQTSMGLDRAGWVEFWADRKRDVHEKKEWLADSRNREAVMAVLMEYPVTQKQLEDMHESDSLSADYLGNDLNPGQLAVRQLLEQNIVHPKAEDRPLSAPFYREAFNRGFNYFYMQYAGRNATPLTHDRINGILIECLGVHGRLVSHRPHDGKRVYWFPMRLGSLCDAFENIVGGTIPRETPAHSQIGEWKPDAVDLRTAAATWSRVDMTSNF